jgi:hypothetical protein
MKWRDRRDGLHRLEIPMTADATDTTEESITADDRTRRYAELNVGGEEFVIYDRENHQAWIQSTVAVPVEETC